MQGGILLATDSIPQGDMLVIPITKSVGLQKNTLIIVHFKKGSPDMGRKTFQPELTDLSIKIAKRITNIFISYKAYLRPNSGEDKRMSTDRSHYDWHQGVIKWREENQLAYSFIKNFTYYSKPQEEQDVIAIFHQLVGCGIIRGLYFYSTEYNEKYDGLFELHYDNDNFSYSDKNPLGVIAEDYSTSNFRSPPKSMEYKYDFEALLNDMEGHDKHFEHLGLVVCWKASGIDKNDSILFKSLLVEKEGSNRTVFGATHIVDLPTLYSHHSVEVIVLEDLINFVIEPEAEIVRQKVKYGYL